MSNDNTNKLTVADQHLALAKGFMAMVEVEAAGEDEAYLVERAKAEALISIAASLSGLLNRNQSGFF